jgi:hypothetical protein
MTAPVLWITMGVLVIGQAKAPPPIEQPGEVSLRGGSTIWTIRQTRVQEELGLTRAQKATVDVIWGQFQKQLTDLYAVAHNLEGEAYIKARDECRVKERDVIADAGRKVLEMLTADQASRLDQIFVQALGNQVLFHPVISERLVLTDQQRAQFTTINAKQAQKVQSASRDYHAGKLDETGLRQTFENVQQETRAEMVALLTDAQRKILKELTGKPYDRPQMHMQVFQVKVR